MKALVLRNKQRCCCFATRPLRRDTRVLLEDQLRLKGYNLSITFVSPRRMANLNWEHLRHEGPTDILTFDYTSDGFLHGELVICPRVAEQNARRYRVSLEKELRRYIIHGVLHLLGHDDKDPRARRKMKREENRLLKRLTDYG